MIRSTATPDLKFKFAVIAAAATMGAASIVAGAVGEAKLAARDSNSSSSQFSMPRMAFPPQQ